MSIEALFEPMTVRNLHVDNRFVMSAMSYYKNYDGCLTDDFVEYHRLRAAGGIGFAFTGAVGIDRPASKNHPHLADVTDATAASWRRLVEVVHGEGCPIAMQLWHAGALFNVAPGWLPAPLESPSGIAAPSRTVGEPMSDEALVECIEAYGRAAALAMQIGFDAVEIHGAHGFLIDQFFWDATNLRTDRWGGRTIGERTAFATEVVRAVRDAIGPDTALFMKISQWKEQDYAVKLATTADELVAWLGPLRDAGVDVFDCSQRRYWEPELPGSDLNLAGWVKRELATPTITLGSVGLANDAMAFFGGEAAERDRLDELVRRFERGEFDLVGVARSILADPDWVRRARANTVSTLPPIDLRRLDLGLDL